MEQSEDYGKFISWGIRWISKNPMGIKFMAKADIWIQKKRKQYIFDNLEVIDEYVCFHS